MHQKRFLWKSKHTSIYLAGLLYISLFTSCEKVVYIDLNTSSPIPVVEGYITDHTQPCSIKLSHSVNYYDPNVFPALTDAVVSVSDNVGNSEVLHQTSDGMYQSSSIQGTPGRTYTLKILYKGIEYSAHSYLPAPVAMDSVIIMQNPPGGGGFGGGLDSIPGYRITTIFKDPPGLGNYYRLWLHSNDSLAINKGRYHLATDKLSDGDEMSISYNTKLRPGDSLTVTLECIDKYAFDYFSTLGSVVGDGSFFMSAPPANPVNNISNGGLGYFSAYSYTEKKFVVQ